MKLFYKVLRRVERSSAKMQGKGFGTSSIEAETKAISTFLNKGDVRLCIDIGGNVGDYTARLAQLFQHSKIVTFEPSQTNIAKLQERFAKHEDIVICPFAVSDEKGHATLFSNEPGSGLGSLSQRKLDHFNIEFDVEEEIKTIRFEDYWKSELEGAPIDIVKLDIEGHELSALRGFGEAIRHISVIQFEFGGCNIDTKTYFQDFWYFFEKHGFDLYRITPLGVMGIYKYQESDEFFSTTNYLAVARKVSGSR